MCLSILQANPNIKNYRQSLSIVDISSGSCVAKWDSSHTMTSFRGKNDYVSLTKSTQFKKKKKKVGFNFVNIIA